MTATITRDGTDLATDITIVQTDLRKAIRQASGGSDMTLETQAAAFLVSQDDCDWRDEPEIGDVIEVGEVIYRVGERPEIDACWDWHDRERVQRVVFVREWSE